MAKCGRTDCTEKAIGGFQQVIYAGTIDDPTATILGMKAAWCRSHEDDMKQGLGQGRFLSAEELG